MLGFLKYKPKFPNSTKLNLPLFKSYSVLAMILALLVLGIYTRNAWVFLHFKYNQEAIAAELCVEREVESSSCNGNCQLNKRITEPLEHNEQPQHPTNEQNNYKLNWNVACSIKIWQPISGEEKRAINYPPYFLRHSGIDPSGLYRPPIVVS